LRFIKLPRLPWRATLFFWTMLVAGKGLGEDLTNGAAARPVVAAKKGRAREDRVFERDCGRAVNQQSSSYPATSS